MKPGAILLASSKAGGTDDNALAEVSRILGDSYDVEPVLTSTRAELDAALEKCSGRLIVVAGGDGTLHTVIAAVFRRGELAGADLALVPLGTGNDFAQTVGIPLDAAAAARLIGTSVRRPLDLIVDDRADVVVNVAHAGVGADAAERASALKSFLGAAAYPIGAVVAAATGDGWAVTVEADGHVVHADEDLLMVAICNGRTIGGGTELCPVADPGDGLLDVIVVTALGATARIGFGAELRRGDHFQRDDVNHVRARTVTISGTELSFNSDGEISPPAASRVFSVLPSCWTLRVPAVGVPPV